MGNFKRSKRGKRWRQSATAVQWKKKKRKRQGPAQTPSRQVDRGKLHFGYLIYSPSLKCVYIGWTVRPWVRIRKHRGEITGGARKTKRAKDWIYLAIVTPFLNCVDGQQFEWRWRKETKGTASQGCQRLLRLLDYNSKWTTKALPVAEALRNQLGPFHVFWFANLPTRWKPDRHLIIPRVVQHFDADIETVQSHWKQTLEQHKQWKQQDDSNTMPSYDFAPMT